MSNCWEFWKIRNFWDKKSFLCKVWCSRRKVWSLYNLAYYAFLDWYGCYETIIFIYSVKKGFKRNNEFPIEKENFRTLFSERKPVIEVKPDECLKCLLFGRRFSSFSEEIKWMYTLRLKLCKIYIFNEFDTFGNFEKIYNSNTIKWLRIVKPKSYWLKQFLSSW